MGKKYVECKLNEVPDDSRLGADILDSQGQLLMPAGSILSQQAIDQLTTRKIETIIIVQNEIMTKEQIAVLEGEIKTIIDYRFRKSIGLPLMDELQKALINYRLKELES